MQHKTRWDLWLRFVPWTALVIWGLVIVMRSSNSLGNRICGGATLALGLVADVGLLIQVLRQRQPTPPAS